MDDAAGVVVQENLQLRRERDAARAELAAWHAECDKVGVPYDAPGLVRHHRGNAGLAGALEANNEMRPQLDAARAALTEAVAVLRDVLHADAHKKMVLTAEGPTRGYGDAALASTQAKDRAHAWLVAYDAAREEPDADS